MNAKLRVNAVEDRSFQGDKEPVEMWIVTLVDADFRMVTPFEVRLMRPKAEDLRMWQEREGKEFVFAITGTLRIDSKSGAIKAGGLRLVEETLPAAQPKK